MTQYECVCVCLFVYVYVCILLQLINSILIVISANLTMYETRSKNS